MPVVYLAGPIAGHNIDMMQDWRYEAADWLAQLGIRSLDPLRGKTKEAIEAFLAGDILSYAVNTSNSAIVQRDKYDVLRADVILANLSYGNKASIGTMFELAWAHMAHKPIVAVLPADMGLYRHPFVLEVVGWHCRTLREALACVGDLLLPLAAGRLVGGSEG
jgi:nucleoside 2-deoxyribosyltransferase